MTKHEKQHSGYFGEFGGRFVAELLVSSLDEVETAMKTLPA